MIPIQLIVGISCVVVAAAAIYFSLPARAVPHQPPSARRRNCSSYDDADKSADKRSFRKSKPGDKCILCLQPMTTATMHTMNCGHALCRSPCFLDYRGWRRNCPYCEKVVMRINIPGDDCSICCEPLTEETIEYLKCEHALHQSCLLAYRQNHFKTCPLCKKEL